MANIWDEFDEAIDTEGLQEDIEKAAEGGGDYAEVPEGDYEVEITKLELGKSKKDKPMLVVWMKIVSGDYKGQLLFYYQTIDQGFGLHNANLFMRSLDTGLEIEFKSYKQYHGVIEAVKAKADECEFGVNYKINDKGFSIYKVNDIYDKED